MSQLDTVLLNIIKKGSPPPGKKIGDLFGHASGEDTPLLPLLNVFASSLNKMAGELFTKLFSSLNVSPLQGGKFWFQQGEQIMKCCVISRVRRCREQQEVACGICRQPLKQFKAKLLPLSP